MRPTLIHTCSYKHPVIYNCRLHAIILVTVGSHLLTIFAISDLTHCPIQHSGCLKLNFALLLRYSKSEFKKQLILYTKGSAKC